MKTEPIRHAEIAFDAEGTAHAVAFGSAYGRPADALAHARRVFLAGSGLPARWQGRSRFVVLECGFGPGNNFLATWSAWRDDAQRCDRLVYIAIDKHPPRRDDLRRAHADSPLPALASALIDAWPPATPNLHPIDVDGGAVRLLLGWGDVALLLPQLLAPVDAFYLDGFAPDRNPAMWEPRLMKQLGRLAAPRATVATGCNTPAVRQGLTTAGFALDGAVRGATADAPIAGEHAPRHRPAPLQGGLHRHLATNDALVIGAGLAGCAAAWALAREGWQVQVLERGSDIATATSGNPAGLFHGAVHAGDGPHARLHRAAALRTARVLRPWIDDGRVQGQLAGVLRADGAPDAHASPSTEFARALDAAHASAHTGLTLPSGGWWFPDGGWVAPRDYARALIAASGARCITGVDVAAIERRAGRWHALDGAGRSLASAASLVLATAVDLKQLLEPAQAQALGPLAAVRGQLTGLPAVDLPAPRVPVAGQGYVLPPIGDRLWFGATSDDGDATATTRDADDRRNLAQLAALTGQPALGHRALDGATARVGWRSVTPDRLPLVGALPHLPALAAATRADRPRLVPRLRDADGGLYVIGGFGSRGIGWAALCGDLLASWITGGPCPLEADLRDALDPARALLRMR